MDGNDVQVNSLLQIYYFDIIYIIMFTLMIGYEYNGNHHTIKSIQFQGLLKVITSLTFQILPNS